MLQWGLLPQGRSVSLMVVRSSHRTAVVHSIIGGALLGVVVSAVLYWQRDLEPRHLPWLALLSLAVWLVDAVGETLVYRRHGALRVELSHEAVTLRWLSPHLPAQRVEQIAGVALRTTSRRRQLLGVAGLGSQALVLWTHGGVRVEIPDYGIKHAHWFALERELKQRFGEIPDRAPRRLEWTEASPPPEEGPTAAEVPLRRWQLQRASLTPLALVCGALLALTPVLVVGALRQGEIAGGLGSLAVLGLLLALALHSLRGALRLQRRIWHELQPVLAYVRRRRRVPGQHDPDDLGTELELHVRDLDGQGQGGRTVRLFQTTRKKGRTGQREGQVDLLDYDQHLAPGSWYRGWLSPDGEWITLARHDYPGERLRVGGLLLLGAGAVSTVALLIARAG